MQVTVSKQMPNKFVLKDAPFYDYLLAKKAIYLIFSLNIFNFTGVITATHKDKSGNNFTESTCSEALETVVGNAKDWDGHRSERSRQSKKRRRSQDESN